MSTETSTSPESAIEEHIDDAAAAVGSVWPLHSFVTANPLAGFEDRPFHEAVADARDLLGGDGYPSADVFRAAWEDGRIDPETLRNRLREHGYDPDPEASLEQLAAREEAGDATTSGSDQSDPVDAVLTKWLAAFLDQGQAAWSMPNREEGFYAAFRSVAQHDGEIPDSGALAELPGDPVDAIRDRLASYTAVDWPEIFEFQLAALPGWTGLIKQRASEGGEWQEAYPITLAGYLAVRLELAERFDAPIAPDEAEGAEGDAESVRRASDDSPPLPEIWLGAWEASYRKELVEPLTDASAAIEDQDDGAGDSGQDGERPDAQLVFCIDTRSEIIRRHVEAAGNYETHGYAGFFGVPMRHEGYGADVTVDACPPVLDAQHRIAERPSTDAAGERSAYERWQAGTAAATEAIEHLETNAATAFSFVESTGVGYAAGLAARTLVPDRVYDLLDGAAERVPDEGEFCEPDLEHDHEGDDETGHELPAGLSLEERVEYAATAFELMGWEQFARLVVFTGHASQTANNPFDSSLDCGACAGNPGGPNARVLAAICNDEAVREQLAERGIEIPEDTVFLAGEHNTTTDEIALFAGDVPESHASDLAQLQADLEHARAGAAAERVGDMGADPDGGSRDTQRRAADWAETRPEWGLAGNAGFVIGPRDLTEGLDLDGRCFLHSYDWSTDPEGDALETILTGPMVVTQWINTQYYFSTVDTAVFGSGSKVTQNPVGNVGVYQGNGGDLMAGLPLQSLKASDDEPYHQPLRLSTVVHAPVERVTEILASNEAVATLLDNGWLSLTVVDPEQDHRAFHYEGELKWAPLSGESVAPEPEPVPPSAADD